MPLCRAYTLVTTIFALGFWVGITQAGELKDKSQQNTQGNQAGTSAIPTTHAK